MARKKGAKVAANAETAVLDYRHDEAKRKNIPPAGLAAQGEVRETPKIKYAYDPHLPPVLRFDTAGGADSLHEGPQTITLRGKPAVVVVAFEEFQKLTRPGTSLREFFRKSPLYDTELDLERSQDLSRAVPLKNTCWMPA